VKDRRDKALVYSCSDTMIEIKRRKQRREEEEEKNTR